MKALTFYLSALSALCFQALPSWAAIHYVNLDNPTPVAPYLTWTTAATNIQDGVDAAAEGDEVVVTNGVYAVGGRALVSVYTNRVAVTKPLMLRSVNGPKFTAIEGYPAAGTDAAVSCVYLAEGAILSGFTLRNGAAHNQGGGVYCESVNAVVTNCILVNNSVVDTFGSGGGVYSGTLNNCTLMGNSGTFVSGGGGGASYAILNNCTLLGNQISAGSSPSGGSDVEGGGAYQCMLNNCLVISNVADANAATRSPYAAGGGTSSSSLNNCTLAGNSARSGGDGAYNCSLTNCISYFNSGDNYSGCTLGFCCTTPAALGQGNIAADPLFVDTVAGDLHLQSNSPCINAGNNFYVNSSTDLDGNPRIANGTVDMGADEFQGGFGLKGFHAWLAQYGLSADGSADFTDSDGDGMNNWQEWRCGTNPTNANSVLRLLSPVHPGPLTAPVTVTWQSVLGIGYSVERATNLVPAIFSTLASNLPGQTAFQSYTDTTATNSGHYFYRIGAQ